MTAPGTSPAILAGREAAGGLEVAGEWPAAAARTAACAPASASGGSPEISVSLDLGDDEQSAGLSALAAVSSSATGAGQHRDSVQSGAAEQLLVAAEAVRGETLAAPAGPRHGSVQSGAAGEVLAALGVDAGVAPAGTAEGQRHAGDKGGAGEAQEWEGPPPAQHQRPSSRASTSLPLLPELQRPLAHHADMHQEVRLQHLSLCTMLYSYKPDCEPDLYQTWQRSEEASGEAGAGDDAEHRSERRAAEIQ